MERKCQEQPSRSFLKKRCSENMQQIYSRRPMSKCDFNEVACPSFLKYALKPWQRISWIKISNLDSGCQGLGLLSSALDSENSLRVKFRSLVCGFWAIVINIDYLSRQGINCLSVNKMFLDITKSGSVHMEQKDNSWTVVCYYGWKTYYF